VKGGWVCDCAWGGGTCNESEEADVDRAGNVTCRTQVEFNHRLAFSCSNKSVIL